MPHQCVKCSRILPKANRELLEGCAKCHSKFFFYIREEQLEQLKHRVIEIPENEKLKIEKDVRDIAGITDMDAPIILDFESVSSIINSAKCKIVNSSGFPRLIGPVISLGLCINFTNPTIRSST